MKPYRGAQHADWGIGEKRMGGNAAEDSGGSGHEHAPFDGGGEAVKRSKGHRGHPT